MKVTLTLQAISPLLAIRSFSKVWRWREKDNTYDYIINVSIFTQTFSLISKVGGIGKQIPIHIKVDFLQFEEKQ